MDKQKFKQCRDEIVKIMEKYEAENWEPVKILFSALNEELSGFGWQARLTLAPLPAFDEVGGKN